MTFKIIFAHEYKNSTVQDLSEMKQWIQHTTI